MWDTIGKDSPTTFLIDLLSIVLYFHNEIKDIFFHEGDVFLYLFKY